MARILYLLFLIVSCNIVFAQINVINPKGTKLEIDTSKWRISGTNIFNKNIGNVGIGTSNPSYKIDVNSASNPMRLLGLQLGTVGDSMLTMQTGIIKKFKPLNEIAWLQNGNSYNALGVLGTLDGNDLSFITNGNEHFHLDTRGNNFGGGTNSFGRNISNGFIHGSDNYVESNGSPSFTLGTSNNIDASDNSSVFGEKNTITSSNYSLIAGTRNNIEKSNYKYLFGDLNVSSGNSPFHYLFGDNNTSNSNGSHLYSFGEKNIAGKEYLMAFGKSVDFSGYNNGFSLGDANVSTFLTLNSSSSFLNANGGNVGIGNTNPVYNLDITGKLRVTDSAVTNSLRIINTANGNSTTDSLLVITPTSEIVKKIRPGSLPLLGDVIGTLGSNTVTKIQGRNVNSVAPATNQVLKWDGTQWLPANEAASTNWLLTGNSNATYAANFLGTTNDIPLAIRSNNVSMFEVGRRGGPIGLVNNTGGLFPYNDANASVAYVRGTGGNSALQFEASGAAFYKPIFFTDANGNFKMRGSSAGTDFFELGSAGAANAGSLDFVIGDDGDEPMTFRKYNYSPVGYIEMLRMQGTGLNNTVRVGVNVNSVTPTSTFQVVGSVATAITSTATALTLTEIHHTVIVTAGVNITLPAANTCAGRIYIVKKTAAGTSALSSYIDTAGVASTTLNQGVYQLQSDGTNWQRIN